MAIVRLLYVMYDVIILQWEQEYSLILNSTRNITSDKDKHKHTN